MKFIYISSLLYCVLAVFSCQEHSPRGLSQPSENTFGVPRNWQVDVLFDAADSVIVRDSLSCLAKGNHDMIVYIPIAGSSEHGYLVVSHETIVIDSVYGDGGGATIFEIKKKGINWDVVSKRFAIDFSPVHQTALNCGGKLSPNGTILMAEEIAPKDKSELLGFDTTKYKPTEFGWIVEVNPITKKAIRKLHNLGRYKHEDIYVMPDNKIMYITNDDTPAILFKFVCKSSGEYDNGQLYAYNEQDSIHWIMLPMDKFSLENARDVAISKGATMFVRHEWVTVVNNMLYITETGNDKVNWKEHMRRGGIPASYFPMNSDSITSDYYGRVLKLNLRNDSLSVYYDGTPIFANPDCITALIIDSVQYLVVAEDIIGTSHGRSSESEWGNGLWLYNLQTKERRKIMQAPNGSEITGLQVTPDQKTLFVNIQHPDKGIESLNGSTTLSIQIRAEK